MKNESSRMPILILFLGIPGLVLAQSDEARILQTKLSKSASEPSFALMVDSGLRAIRSADDTVWILAEMASIARLPDQRKTLLVQRASTLELLARYHDAAMDWETAASAMPNVADPVALLSSAVCRLAAGELEDVERLAGAVSFLSADAVTAKLALIVNSWASTIQQRQSSVPGSIKMLVDDADQKIALTALLYAVSVSEGTERDGYVGIMARRFPSLHNAYTTMPFPFILSYIASAKSEPVIPHVPASPPADSPVKPGSGSLYYQVGAFRSGSTADSVTVKLKGMGLRAYTKYNANKDLHIVYVIADSDPGKTVLTIKDAGFEAWPLDSVP
jgi:hypothetical protein